MRDPKQEARRIPHSYQDTPSGGKRVVLHHESDGLVPCPDAEDYASASKAAVQLIETQYPGRSL